MIPSLVWDKTPKSHTQHAATQHVLSELCWVLLTKSSCWRFQRTFVSLSLRPIVKC